MVSENEALQKETLTPVYVVPEDEQLLYMYEEVRQAAASRTSSMFVRGKTDSDVYYKGVCCSDGRVDMCGQGRIYKDVGHLIGANPPRRNSFTNYRTQISKRRKNFFYFETKKQVHEKKEENK